MLGAASFARHFVLCWLEVVRDPCVGGVAESIDAEGCPDTDAPRTTLTQARCAFALAHLFLATGEERLLNGAIDAWRFLDTHLRDPDGGYRAAVAADGHPLQDVESRRRRAYDQSFVLLALTTLDKAAPGLVPEGRVISLWAFIEYLTDPVTGALWQDDRMAREGAGAGDKRGQNPQMHMLEAVLQAHEMSGEDVWLDRAARYVDVALSHLIDPQTGAVREWVGPHMDPLSGPDGARREPGHQYEWAWLFHRYADFGGDALVRDMAARMQAFAETHGLRREGPMTGAPFDALDADGAVTEAAHLLWPATEAGKLYAARHLATGDIEFARAARHIERLIFECFFGTKAPFHWNNRLDAEASALEARAPSRLIYHVALFVTEGARAGLWNLTSPDAKRSTTQQEEITR